MIFVWPLLLCTILLAAAFLVFNNICRFLRPRPSLWVFTQLHNVWIPIKNQAIWVWHLNFKHFECYYLILKHKLICPLKEITAECLIGIIQNRTNYSFVLHFRNLQACPGQTWHDEAMLCCRNAKMNCVTPGPCCVVAYVHQQRASVRRYCPEMT